MTTVRNILLLSSAFLIMGLLYVPNEAKKKPHRRFFIKVITMEDCPEYAGKYENVLVNVTESYSGAGVDGVFIVGQKDMPHKLMLRFVSEKCQTLKDTNCERIFSTQVDFCKILVDKKQFYSDAYGAIHPPMKCPIKQGVYIIKNSTLSFPALENLFKVIPEEYYNSYWKFTLKTFPPGKPKKERKKVVEGRMDAEPVILHTFARRSGSSSGFEPKKLSSSSVISGLQGVPAKFLNSALLFISRARWSKE